MDDVAALRRCGVEIDESDGAEVDGGPVWHHGGAGASGRAGRRDKKAEGRRRQRKQLVCARTSV